MKRNPATTPATTRQGSAITKPCAATYCKKMSSGNVLSHRAYVTKARAYIDARRLQPIDCALCGKPVSMQASSMASQGPTVEHRIPVRKLRRIAQSKDELIALVCNDEWWAIAHRKCQSHQGGETQKPRKKSREW